MLGFEACVYSTMNVLKKSERARCMCVCVCASLLLHGAAFKFDGIFLALNCTYLNSSNNNRDEILRLNEK